MKLVSEAGVGTVAAGVAKAKADLVLISGDSGGTGASPLTSIKHAGTPWELGLAETQQTLVVNDLRSRIRVETDGQLKTGRDVAVAALLGAEEFGFGTAALVAERLHPDARLPPQHLPGRHGHPGSGAAQALHGPARARDQLHVLRRRRAARDHGRARLPQLDEMVGRVDMLERAKRSNTGRRRASTFSRVLHKPEVPPGTRCAASSAQDHGLDGVLDHKLIELCKPALERRHKVQRRAADPQRQPHRRHDAVGEVSRRYGAEGLPADTIELEFNGSAGQSFGAFMAPGISARIEGDANDYVGKGLSGGRIVVVPPQGCALRARGEHHRRQRRAVRRDRRRAVLRGSVGERFCVRNSGATAVVEGVGDHGCEYMTRGVA